MAHHGSESFSGNSRLAEIFTAPDEEKARDFLNSLTTKIHDMETAKLAAGPTGQFPEGKIDATDEGELVIVVGQQDGKVVINFGKPTAWIGFTAEQSEDLGRLLIEHGREARLRRGATP